MTDTVEQVRRASALFSQAYAETDGFGVAHDIVAMGNVGDHFLVSCLNAHGLTPREADLIHHLRAMPVRERLIAYHLSTGGSRQDLCRAEKMADEDMARFGGMN